MTKTLSAALLLSLSVAARAEAPPPVHLAIPESVIPSGGLCTERNDDLVRESCVYRMRPFVERMVGEALGRAIEPSRRNLVDAELVSFQWKLLGKWRETYIDVSVRYHFVLRDRETHKVLVDRKEELIVKHEDAKELARAWFFSAPSGTIQDQIAVAIAAMGSRIAKSVAVEELALR
jgi:hypothetical protein